MFERLGYKSTTVIFILHTLITLQTDERRLLRSTTTEAIQNDITEPKILYILHSYHTEGQRTDTKLKAGSDPIFKSLTQSLTYMTYMSNCIPISQDTQKQVRK